MRKQSVVKIDYLVEGVAHELCAVGGWMAQGWKSQSSQDLHEPPPGFNAADAWFHPLEGVSGVIRFATEEAFPDHASAQAAFAEPEVIEGVSLLAATGTLRVTAGTVVVEWEHAVLESVIPSLPSDSIDAEGNSISTVVRAFAFRVPAVPSMA